MRSLSPGCVEGVAGGGQHRGELVDVVGVLGDLGGDDDLLAGGDQLRVVTLHRVPVAAHQPAVRIGRVHDGVRARRLVLSAGAAASWAADPSPRGQR